jgi:hypothetical protein
MGTESVIGKADGSRLEHLTVELAEKLAKVTSHREIAPGYEDREQGRSRAHSGRVSR